MGKKIETTENCVKFPFEGSATSSSQESTGPSKLTKILNEKISTVRMLKWAHRRSEYAHDEMLRTGLKRLHPHESVKIHSTFTRIFGETRPDIKNQEEFIQTIQQLSIISLEEFCKGWIEVYATHRHLTRPVAELWLVAQDLAFVIPMDKISALRKAWRAIS